MKQGNIETTLDLQQLRALFDAASDAEGSARQSLLDGADPALRWMVAEMLCSDEQSHPYV